MSILNFVVLIAAVACTYLAQARFMSFEDKRSFSLLGSVSCVVVMIDALGRQDTNSALFFAMAGLMNLGIAVASFLKPSTK